MDMDMTEEDFRVLKVLVVEDEAFAQQLATRALGLLGVTDVTCAGNGSQALKILEAPSTAFGLVISDIEMPEMDGFELARRIRNGFALRYKDIPILLLTGRSTRENVLKGRELRIQGFVVKPPGAEALKRHIKRAFTGK